MLGSELANLSYAAGEADELYRHGGGSTEVPMLGQNTIRYVEHDSRRDADSHNGKRIGPGDLIPAID